jgi:peptide/nickel transport system permease protein
MTTLRVDSERVLRSIDSSIMRRARRIAQRNPGGAFGAALVSLAVLVALLGPLAWRVSPNNQDYDRLLPPSVAHPMGTDGLGRDELARVIHGAQVSLEVALISVLIALVLGVLIGILAGYFGAWIDLTLMRLVDIMFAFPALVLAILIAGLLGPSRTNATFTIGLVFAPAFARVARASALSVMATPYVEASRALGASARRIMARDVLPNITAPIIVMATVYISSAIIIEAALSFLGLGTQPPEASWGNMLSEGRTYMQLAWWLAVFPGLAIVVAVLGFNFLGDGLRDTLDPRARDRL